MLNLLKHKERSLCIHITYKHNKKMTNFKNKGRIRALSIIIAACMLFITIPVERTFAASMLTKTYVNSITVGNSAGDNVKISVNSEEPFSIDVKCTHSQEFDQMDVRVYYYGKNNYAFPPDYINSNLGAGETWEESFLFKDLAKGKTYRLSVYKKDSTDKYKQYRPYVDRIYFDVTDKGVKLIDYSSIKSNNKKVRALYDPLAYKEKDLVDFKNMLFNRAASTSKRTIKSSTEKAYYKKIADSIVKSSDSNYIKMRKLYEYVADKLYYDNYKSKAYDDPYYNLRHINKLDKASGYNWSNGKVAVQCDGYAGLLIALGRSQGIPCRMVSGNLLSSSTETWNSQSSVKKQTHCWVQAYINNKWIEIDPCRASSNQRNSNGSWTKAPQISYMFFDMNDVQMAHTHCSVTYYGGDTSPKFIYDSDEKAQLKKFLNYSSNGKKLNSSYKSTNTATWSKESVFYTNGKGNVQYISWKKKGLKGKLNLNEFKALKNVSISNNQLTALTLKGCTSLNSVYACSNKLTTINTSTVKNAKVIDTRYNKLKTAYVYLNKAKRTFVVKGKGSFGFKTNGSKITVYSKANSGYKVKGIYTSSGKRISSKSTCTFKPKSSKYYVKFVRK